MKIAIVGSRGYANLDFVVIKTHELFFPPKYQGVHHEFISGGSSVKDSNGEETSVDKCAEDYIDELNRIYKKHFTKPINKTVFKPDWNKYGKRAGAIRNQQIVDEADKIVAFWDGKSKGTKITIDMAIKANKPIDIL